jgi:carboxyl-terminal processing protease
MDKMSLEKRKYIFHKTLSLIEKYFAHWERIPDISLKKLNKEYALRVQKTIDRYYFYLLMSELISKLKNTHTWYTDNLVWKRYGMQTGFRAVYMTNIRRWIVVSSNRKDILIGDVITKVNGISTEKFFKDNKKYISASNERAARNNLFSFYTFLPIRFDLELNGKKKIDIKRTESVYSEGEGNQVSYKILSKKIAYLKIKSFGKPKFEKTALKYMSILNKFPAVIIDLRDNYGGTTPLKLTKRLSNKPWRRPIYLRVVHSSTSQNVIGLNKFKGKNYYVHNSIVYKKTISKTFKPSRNAYKGKLIMLANESTLSAAEDFLIMFKDNKRALIIGNRTKGSDGDVCFSKLDKNVSIGVGCVRVQFPDGRDFEGVGIVPDIIVYPKIEDLRNNIDAVLNKALEITISDKKR